eukprot:gene23756-28483_t
MVVSEKTLKWALNYNGSIYGGTIYGATDPFYALLFDQLLQREGFKVRVWLKSASIQYLKPGRSSLYFTISVNDQMLREAVEALNTVGKFVKAYPMEVKDKHGELCATVMNEVYVRNLHHGEKKLILQGEGTTIDFKKTITNLEKIAKSLVAFANNKGGQLLIGVADDGTIKGVKSEDEEKYMILKSAHQYCKPAIEPEFEEVYVDDKLVLVVTIRSSDTKPHYALDEQKKWWVYFRVDDRSVLASKILVDVLKKGNKDTGHMISYTEDEKKLFEYLREEGRITLLEFSKIIRSSHRHAQKILVNMILTGVLLPHSSEKEEYFTMTERTG